MVNLADFVQTVLPFNQLASAEMEQVRQQLAVVSVPQGATIHPPGGEPSRHLYLIREGLIRLERDEQPVILLEAGELFGYPSLLSGKPPAFTAIAEERAQVYQWPESLFRDLLNNQSFAQFFLRSLSERLRNIAIIEMPALSGNLSVAVGSLSRRSPIFVSAHTTIVEAAQIMRHEGISSVLVRSDPDGIVTDGGAIAYWPPN